MYEELERKKEELGSRHRKKRKKKRKREKNLEKSKRVWGESAQRKSET
jgi:hypothetical protein